MEARPIDQVKVGEKLGTPAEVAEYLRLTEKTLAQMRYQRRGPAYVKVGRSVRYRWAAVVGWISAGGDAA